MKIKYVPSTHYVWLIVILRLHVNVQNALLRQNVFVAVMEKHMSMNANYENNLVQQKRILEFFMMANAVRSLNDKLIIST